MELRLVAFFAKIVSWWKSMRSILCCAIIIESIETMRRERVYFRPLKYRCETRRDSYRHWKIIVIASPCHCSASALSYRLSRRGNNCRLKIIIVSNPRSRRYTLVASAWWVTSLEFWGVSRRWFSPFEPLVSLQGSIHKERKLTTEPGYCETILRCDTCPLVPRENHKTPRRPKYPTVISGERETLQTVCSLLKITFCLIVLITYLYVIGSLRKMSRATNYPELGRLLHNFRRYAKKLLHG